MITLTRFSTPSCGPCKTLAVTLQNLSVDGVTINTVDVEQEPSHIETRGIRAVPTCILFDADGEELSRFSGVRTAEQIRQFIETNRP